MADDEIDTESRRLAAELSSLTPVHRSRHHLSVACYQMIRFLALAEKMPRDTAVLALDMLMQRAQKVRDEWPINPHKDR